MVRLWIVLGVAAAVFYIYSVADCAFFDRSRVRGLPKPLWIIVIVLFPVIGGLLWFFIGRGRRRDNGARRTVAPDDDPEFLKRLGRDRDQEERIRQLEKELSDLDDNGPDDQTGRRDA
ncbi:PLD nuclease N-terminal domain-containing protein [Leifsonia poae]|uniref:PLD nuclease N-terminal domain-containing protein n=1 Tax=Leifsonia poae TaxID=110933 RepID=UPI001CBD6FE6|nr:PLD nuclease N-terminal domain-containing protein [Leifsonia poae]